MRKDQVGTECRVEEVRQKCNLHKYLLIPPLCCRHSAIHNGQYRGDHSLYDAFPLAAYTYLRR